jgi:hypothetical protein
MVMGDNRVENKGVRDTEVVIDFVGRQYKTWAMRLND